MGGKLWTQAEERIFWTVIIPQSPKRVGIDQHNDERSWEQLVNVMNKAMLDATGETDEAKLPRKYTKLSLFEHWFQNVMKGNISAHARQYVVPLVQRMEELGIPRTGRGFRPREPKPPKDATARRGRKATKRRAAGKQAEAVAEVKASPGVDEAVAGTSGNVVTTTTTAETSPVAGGTGNSLPDNGYYVLGFWPDNHGSTPRPQGETGSALTDLSLPFRPGSAWDNHGHSESTGGSQESFRLPSMQLNPSVGPNRAPYAPMAIDNNFAPVAPMMGANHAQYASLGGPSRDLAPFGQMGESSHASHQMEAPPPSYPVHPSYSAQMETNRFPYPANEPTRNQGQYAAFDGLSSNPYTPAHKSSPPQFAPLSQTNPRRALIAPMSPPSRPFMTTQQRHRGGRFMLVNSMNQRFSHLRATRGQSGAPTQTRPEQNGVSNTAQMGEASSSASPSEESNSAPNEPVRQKYRGTSFTPINRPVMNSSPINTPQVPEPVLAPAPAAVSRTPLPAGRGSMGQPLDAAPSRLRRLSNEGFSPLNSSRLQGTPAVADPWNTGVLAHRPGNNWVPLTPARPSPTPEGATNPAPIKSALASGGNRPAKKVRIQVPRRENPGPSPSPSPAPGPSTLASTATAALTISPANPDPTSLANMLASPLANQPADRDSVSAPGPGISRGWAPGKHQQDGPSC